MRATTFTPRLIVSLCLLLTMCGIITAQESKKPVETLDGPPEVTAKAWAIADAKTGKILWSMQPNLVRHMASTTKIMTARIVFELIEKNPELMKETVTFSRRADLTSGSTSGVREGEKLPVSDLLYGLLLPSGNDAAVALAEHFGHRFCGKEGVKKDPLDCFVEEMNRQAKKLGMSKTKYLDPHGNSANQATAADLIKLAFDTLKDPRFQKYVRTREHRCELKAKDGKTRTVIWRNTNRLLGIQNYDGVKTGTTTRAGACLVSRGRYGEHQLLMVVLGSLRGGRYVDSRNLYRWAWTKLANGKGKSTGATK